MGNPTCLAQLVAIDLCILLSLQLTIGTAKGRTHHQHAALIAQALH